MVKHDDYMTPFSAWEDVSAYIPRHLALWEAFHGDGTSGDHRDLHVRSRRQRQMCIRDR